MKGDGDVLGHFSDLEGVLSLQQMARMARGLRADEKVDTPITQLVGKHDLVTNLYRDKGGWKAYTTREVSR